MELSTPEPCSLIKTIKLYVNWKLARIAWPQFSMVFVCDIILCYDIRFIVSMLVLFLFAYIRINGSISLVTGIFSIILKDFHIKPFLRIPSKGYFYNRFLSLKRIYVLILKFSEVWKFLVYLGSCYVINI